MNERPLQRGVHNLTGFAVVLDGAGGVTLVWNGGQFHLTPLQCAELSQVLDAVVAETR